MTSEITKVEKGLDGDDFVYNRKTLRIHLGGGTFYLCKLYGDGRLVGYSFRHHDFQSNCKSEWKYVEYDLDKQTVDAIKAKL